ncbi:MAG TPA: L,D-transpeptidase family protein [Pseudomonadales bacterium]|nr:L,D-transpeptidase family protein [Pseudomonadales bacterium]
MLRLFIATLLVLLPTLPLSVAASPATDIATQVQTPLHAIYEARQFAPLWLEGDKPSARATQAIDIMGHAAEDGLNIDDYKLPALQHTLDQLKQQTGTDQQQAAFDLAMSQTLARFIEDLSVGRVTPRDLGLAIDTSTKQIELQQKLAQVLVADDLVAAIAAVRPALPTYAALRQLLADYRVLAAQHPAAPSIPPLPGKKLSPGELWAGTQALADWLIVLGYLPTDTVVTEKYEGAVVDGVKNFQQHHSQIPDGVIGKQTYQNLLVSLPERVQQIELAMERLRWLDDNLLQKRFVVINVPQFTLWAFEPDADGKARPVLQMAVVIGKSGKTETPLMIKTLNSMVFSPYWNVPRSIAIKELLPKLREDPFYLVREDMELVDNNGQSQGSEVEDAELAGIARGTYRIRQRPGQKNALGELKFVFPNDDSIYMHDTPSKSFFAKERRDLSHGCIRLQNPMGFALFALKTQGEWDEAKVKEKIAIGKEQHLALSERMPVLLLYITANVDENGQAVFLQDIYDQDEKLAAALKKEGRGIKK